MDKATWTQHIQIIEPFRQSERCFSHVENQTPSKTINPKAEHITISSPQKLNIYRKVTLCVMCVPTPKLQAPWMMFIQKGVNSVNNIHYTSRNLQQNSEKTSIPPQKCVSIFIQDTCIVTNLSTHILDSSTMSSSFNSSFTVITSFNSS